MAVSEYPHFPNPYHMIGDFFFFLCIQVKLRKFEYRPKVIFFQ